MQLLGCLKGERKEEDRDREKVWQEIKRPSQVEGPDSSQAEYLINKYTGLFPFPELTIFGKVNNNRSLL